ncbi:hypothetical protein KGG70_gp52 [Streptomyces phage Celia]|uniref:Uncharacterized protein n=1 Tax=Streptomyces phage Celia TaxID=2590946 RepID=A0A516KRB0_9CAUD|nr:hypothetical protein KGG70_gp52 [Streptomyces phage Celia]QDP44232.1 hypothetical protein SEA_CELIA_29 [Streptomyces phage Celia]QFG10492.1 membrane protein [Streptomyces phage Urza]QJD50594.1 membrane protein [Streptomyces phage Itza]
MDLLLPLLPAKLQPYAKFVVALVGAVATVVAATYGDNPTVASVISVLTALGVLAQPNADKPAKG